MGHAEGEIALSRHLTGRLEKPDMVLCLAGDQSSFVTGGGMVVDGGYLMV